MMWLTAISGSDGVIANAVTYAAACAAACMPRFCADCAAVCNQVTIGMAAAIARSLLAPVHTALREARLVANSAA